MNASQGLIRTHARGGALAAGALALSALIVIGPLGAGAAQAATAPTLGNADSYAVFAAAGVSSTGSTSLTGDLGLHPGNLSSITGFNGPAPSNGQVSGAIRAADGDALNARNDLRAAYLNLQGQQPRIPVTANLNGRTLTAGVYNASTSMDLSVGGLLQLTGAVDDVFVFQVGSTLTVNEGSRVELLGQVQACNVYWQVGSSATIGTDAVFVGTVLADTSISALTRASVVGRLLAGAITDSGAVTLDTNDITRPASCTAGRSSTTGATGGTTGTTPTTTGTGGTITPPTTGTGGTGTPIVAGAAAPGGSASATGGTGATGVTAGSAAAAPGARAAAPGALAATGSDADLLPIATGAAALILLGGLVLVAGRRRRVTR